MAENSTENYNQLLKRKEELTKEYGKLNQILGGKEEPENAKKIGELNMQKTLLKDELISLEQQVATLRGKIAKIDEEIEEIASPEKESLIFKAMEKKRWFFFKNRKMFLFDRESGYLWANLNHFPLKGLNFKQAKEEIKEIVWHGLGNWKLPTYNEMIFMINDKSFPFKRGSYWRIKDHYSWIYSDGYIDVDNIYNKEYDNSTSTGYYIPCNTKYASDIFSVKNPKLKDIDYGKEKAMAELFAKEGWIPKFDDSKLTELFEAYVKRYQTLEELRELEIKLKELEPKIKRLSPNFDFKNFLVDYNLEEIDNSAIEYAKASIKWIDDLIEGLDSFQSEKKSLFNDGIKIRNKFSNPKNIEELSGEEKEFFHKNREYLKERFDFGMEDLTKQLLEFKDESQNLSEQINSIKNSKNKFIALAEIKEQKRPEFYFFAEYTGSLVKKKLEEMDWFEEHQDYIQKVLRLREDWLDDYDIFINKRKRDFYRLCEDEMIDEVEYSLWFEEWRSERFRIISKLFELITKVDILPPETILKIFELAEKYRDELDKFYKSERIAIHQNPKFKGLLEKYEKEKELSKIRSKFREGLESIIFDLKSTQQKVFLARWAKDWMSAQIEEVVQYIENDKLINTTPAFKKIFDEFKKLEKSNFEQFLSDVRAYEKARKKQEMSYNSLLHKMTVELQKLNNRNKKEK